MDSWLKEIQPKVGRCINCGHHWYMEQPDEKQVLALYEAALPLVPHGAPMHDSSGYVQREMSRFYRLCCTVGARRPALLDYGSGMGRWARAAVNAGFEVWGFEPSRERSQRGGETFHVVRELADLRGRKFDAVNIEQVLEHTPDPSQALRELKQFCKPTTLLRVTVPNILRCFEGKQLWRDWPFDGRRVHTMAPFEHLHGFTPCSLRTLMQRSGFRSLEGGAVWRLYGREQVRRLIGAFFPALDQTLFLGRMVSS